MESYDEKEDEDTFIIPCKCKGTQKYIHPECWAKSNYECMVCNYTPILKTRNHNHQRQQVNHALNQKLESILDLSWKEYACCSCHRQFLVYWVIFESVFSTWMPATVIVACILTLCKKQYQQLRWFRVGIEYGYVALYISHHLITSSSIGVVYAILAFMLRRSIQRESWIAQECIHYITEIAILCYERNIARVETQ